MWTHRLCLHYRAYPGYPDSVDTACTNKEFFCKCGTIISPKDIDKLPSIDIALYTRYLSGSLVQPESGFFTHPTSIGMRTEHLCIDQALVLSSLTWGRFTPEHTVNCVFI